MRVSPQPCQHWVLCVFGVCFVWIALLVSFNGAILWLFSFMFLDLIFAWFRRLREQTWGGGISWSVWGGKGYSIHNRKLSNCLARVQNGLLAAPWSFWAGWGLPWVPVGPGSCSRLLLPGLVSDTAKPLASEDLGQVSLKAIRNLQPVPCSVPTFSDRDVKEALAEGIQPVWRESEFDPSTVKGRSAEPGFTWLALLWRGAEFFPNAERGPSRFQVSNLC